MLAKALHPDRNSRDPNAHGALRSRPSLYQLLKDPDKRQRFDQERRMAEEARRREQASGGARRAEARESRRRRGRYFLQPVAQDGGPAQHAGQGADLTVDVQISIEDISKDQGRWCSCRTAGHCRDAARGVMDGKQVRIAAQGHRLAGLKRGDVVATFRIAPHPVFRADGLDLYTSVPVDIENAVLGCETIVDAPDGMVRVTVPEWSGSDRTLRIRGRGLPGRDGVRAIFMPKSASCCGITPTTR